MTGTPVQWRADAPPTDPHAGPNALQGPYACAVAIPARDEADFIERCLTALAEQQDAPAFAVTLVLNNCTDATAEVIRAMAKGFPFELHVFDVELPAHLADAAWARRLAVNAAASLVDDDGIVLTTDADSRTDPRWMRNTLDCFDAGADIACGFVAPDFTDAPALSFESIRRGALEFEYSQLTTELTSLVDPDPADPWPRHMIETGANLAIRKRVLIDLGGVPHVCPGEDQHLVRMARRAGYKVRHAFPPSVTTSSRVRGRAVGGWSEDLSARLDDNRATCHPRLEPARTTLRRARLRSKLREVFGTREFARRAARLLSEPALSDDITAARHFEEAWAMLEDQSPALAHRQLYARDLEENAALLRRYVLEAERVRNAAHGDQAQEAK